VLFGLYLIPTDSITLMLGKTRWLWIATVAAAGANLALNLAFVPQYGVMAAAVNTAVAYGVLLLGVAIFRYRLPGPRIQFEIHRIAVGVVVVAAAALAGVVLAPEGVGLTALVIRTALVAAAAIVLAVGHLTAWKRPPRQGSRASETNATLRPGETPIVVGTSRG
jgi:O-antigen/teichoic acid export membrane protein